MSARGRDAAVVGAVSAIAVVAWVFALRGRAAPSAWPGVDDAVVGRFVEEAGGRASGPLFEAAQGDALLFAFLIAGLAAGFALGYFARPAFARAEERDPS